MSRIRSTFTACAIATAISSSASAAVLIDTGNPGGAFGFIGFDLYPDQSIAVAFTPNDTYSLDSVSMWMMSNDFEAPGRTFKLQLVTDAAGGSSRTIPSENVLETWDLATTAVGWSPVLETWSSALNPVLQANTTYWIVASSTEPAGFDPLWVQAADDEAHWYSINNSASPGWISGESFAVPGTIINATLVPAPGAMALLGLVGLGAARRRR